MNEDTLKDASQTECCSENEPIDLTQAKIKDLEAKLKESEEKHLYLAAEFENFKKRQIREKSELIKFSQENLIRDLLDIVDSFSRALGSIPPSPENKNILDGIKMIESMFLNVLKKNGVEKVPTTGDFDMNFHEAISQGKAEGKDKNSIVEVHQDGFTLHGRVIRSAKVVVAE